MSINIRKASCADIPNIVRMLVDDACGAGSKELHEFTLKALQRLATVTTTAELISSIRKI